VVSASFEALERVFGREFVEKYQRALARAQELPKEKLEVIKRFALDAMRDSADFRVRYDNLDVILAQAPRDPKKFPVVRTGAGNYKVGMIWAGGRSMRGPFISVFCADKETAQQLVAVPERPWLLVGKLQERQYLGDVTYSFRLMGAIPLE
jgi:hypothetical protein